MIKNSNSNTNSQSNLKLFSSRYFKTKSNDIIKRNSVELNRISIDLTNFQDLKTFFRINSTFLDENLISLSFHLSQPDNVISLSTLPYPSSVKNLVMIFNGLPQFDSFKFINSLNIDIFTINLDQTGFRQFFVEIEETTKIKILNIYLHLNSLCDFNSLFVNENEIIKNIYKKVYALSRACNLEGLNLNVIFDSSIEEEVIKIKEELKLKQLIFNENKYYFGFLKIFSLNIICNPSKDFFIYSGLDKKFNQPSKFTSNDNSVEKSYKLCAKNDISILFALKKRNFRNFVVQNVFKFLAKIEYTIVNLSKTYY